MPLSLTVTELKALSSCTGEEEETASKELILGLCCASSGHEILYFTSLSGFKCSPPPVDLCSPQELLGLVDPAVTKVWNHSAELQGKWRKQCAGS